MKRNTTPRQVHRAFVALAIILGLALILPAPAQAQPPSPLTPGSGNAQAVADLFWIVLAIAAVVFVVVEGLLIFTIVRYRRQYPDEMPRQVHGNARLELIWTVIPSLIMVALFVLTLNTLQAQRNAPPDAMVIEITGRQWFWEFNYADTEISRNSRTDDLIIPAGQPVMLEIRSADVIHSFWVPELAGKQDAIPGRTGTLWFEAEPGTYAGQCAEFCGLDHYAMLFDVVVLPQDEFTAWMDEQVALAGQFQPIGTDLETPLPVGTADQGESLFSELGCAACHSLDGTVVVGPTLLGIAERAATRQDAVAADQYLREAVLLPCDFVVDGFTCVMPQNYGERLDAQDLADLIAYLLEQ
jgi:cytochrome c oxidase subunit 2